MNGAVEEEAPRPRPLSSGIWTLFSWLRRTERSSSSESISSVGSDRTAASFDYLAPFNYKHVSEPLVLPQSPITETYKKRLLERNIRRQNDQDLTLRRKYGLYTEEGLGYDAFSLPPARKIPKDSVRLRRATSEVSQRRAAYVPGKRRAPLPPTVTTSNSLPRNYKRKRPAPKPPTKLIEENKENIEINKNFQMDSKSAQEKRLSENGFSLECKIEKPIKQDHLNQDVKLRSDKSFLKQIFDSKKRYSAIDTNHVKLLPSISELDKQAAEIIESKRSLDARRGYNNDNILKLSGTEGNWICTICLRKYKMTITSCSYCVVSKEPKETVFTNASMNKNVKSANASNTCTQTENVSKSGRRNDVDEKKKLREMLKEMKDSLPKRPKHDKRDNSNILPATETPTLPIGATMKLDQNLSDNILFTETSANKSNDTKVNIQQAKNSFLLSQPCSSKQIVSDIVLSNIGKSKVHKNGISTGNFGNSSKFDIPFAKPVHEICELPKKIEILENKVVVAENKKSDITVNNILTEPQNVNKLLNLGKNDLKSVTKNKECITALPKDSNTSGSKPLLYNVNKDDETVMSAIKRISKPSNHRKDNSSENFKTTQDKFKRQSVLIPIKEVEVINEKLDEMPQNKIETIRLGDVISSKEIQGSNDRSATDTKSSNLHSPLKISSLLNPIYYPKKKILEGTSKNTQTDASKVEPRESLKLNKVSDISKQVFADTKQKTSCSVSVIKEPENTQKKSITETKERNALLHEFTRVNRPDVTTSENNLDIHARRRDLVNQLEQAISKGDEQSAAEAAAKLAKLKLSCSVLSFSSQIVAEPKISPEKFEIPKNNPLDKENTQNITQNDINVTKKVIKIDNLSQTQKNESIENKLKEKPIIASNEHAPVPSTSKCIELNPDQIIPISVWIEDKEAARGPIRLNVPRKSVVGDLKKEAELSLGLEIRLQRWIIGRTLCSNDNTPLTSLAGADLVAPFYLCVVESETKTNNANEETKTANKSSASPTKVEKNVKSGDFYTELMKLEQQALVPNTEVFECGVCIEECAVGAGAVLRECTHTFCRECLCDVIRHCEEPIVSCPAIGCPGALQEREIRALLTTEEHEKWLARGLAVAESGTRNTFHCRTRDCTGWAFCEPGVRRFPCPVCKHTNCLPCQAVHEGETCARYQEKLRQAVNAVEANQTDEGTQALLKSLIDRGEALECPECKAVITKKWGCDWIKCSACKTEICWVTKGRRWGPGGKGDTSGGCRCGIDGKRCHPSCGYCH